MLPDKRTKIVCTLGPSSEKYSVIEKMVEEGMNVARLNFSHGTYESHRKLIRHIRRASKKIGTPVAIIGDLQGPKVRVGTLPKDGVELKIGETVVFCAGKEQMQKEIIPIPYKGIAKDLRKGDSILLDDGLLEVRVIKINGRKIFTKVIVGGLLTSHKGFNVPDVSLSVPTLTNKDIEDLKFVLKENVDFVAISFVREAEDVLGARRIIDRVNKDIKIIVKIEKHEAIKNFDEILKATDAIMIARGDLGVETPAEGVPVLQKKMIEKCLEAAKPVIVATQMLDSMIRNPRPTRAEISDVANAVIDHADAVMLSGETASGKYPVEAVSTMSKIIMKTEASPYDDMVIGKIIAHFKSLGEIIGEAVSLVSEAPGVKLIVVSTKSGNTARLVSRFRPFTPIIAFTPNDHVLRQLCLSWGIKSFKIKPSKNIDEFFKTTTSFLEKQKMVIHGQKIVIVSGDPPGQKGKTSLLKILDV